MQGYLKVNRSARIARRPCPAIGGGRARVLHHDGDAAGADPLFGIIWNVWRPEPATLLAVTGLITTVMTLVLLRLIKGAFIGYLWAKDEQDRGA